MSQRELPAVAGARRQFQQRQPRWGELLRRHAHRLVLCGRQHEPGFLMLNQYLLIITLSLATLFALRGSEMLALLFHNSCVVVLVFI